MPAPSAIPAPRPRPLIASIRAAFWTLVVLAVPACLLTTLAYFTSAHALFAQLSPFRVQYAVLLLALVLFCVALRRHRLALLFLGFATFNAWAVLRAALPGPTPTETAQRPLKILLANVLTSNPDPSPLLTLVATEKPDLIALLEIDRRWQTALTPKLLADYPHVAFRPREDNFGVAILSRHPLSDLQVAFFARDEIPSLDFVLPFFAHPIRILLTHPLPPGGNDYTKRRDQHLAELAKWSADARSTSANDSVSVIILGDLNSTPWCPPLRRLLATAGLRSAAQGHARFSPTWPAPIPFLGIPLDHALSDPSLVCTSHRVGPDIGSDHFPILVEFQPRQPPTTKRPTETQR